MTYNFKDTVNAVENGQAANTGSLTDAGTLTGTEQVNLGKTSGLFGKTLSSVAAWILGAYQGAASFVSLVVSGNVTFSGTGAVQTTVGTTAQQPSSPTAGMFRYNSTTGRYEFYNGSAWVNHTRLSGDTMTGSLTTPALVGSTTSATLDSYVIGGVTPLAASFTTVTTSGQITSTATTGTPPLVIASTTNVPNLNASSLNGATFASPGPIGATTANSAAYTTISASGVITSTVATGTAPFTVASTTNVANLNASSLNGATFAAPGTIGGTTPGAATFASAKVNGPITLKAPSTVTTTTYSQATTDSTLFFNGTASQTLTLLAAATYPGQILYVQNLAAFAVTSASSNVVPAGSTTAGTAILAATAGKWAVLQADGTNWRILMNN